ASSNSAASVPPTYGRIFFDNPVALTGNAAYPPESNFNSLLKSTRDLVFLTDSQTLTNPCDPQGVGTYVVITCYSALPDRLQPPLVNNTKKWAYDANGTDFVQVNAFGHKKKMFDLLFADQKSYVTSFSLLPNSSLKKDTSLAEQYFSNF